MSFHTPGLEHENIRHIMRDMQKINLVFKCCHDIKSSHTVAHVQQDS